MSLGVSGPTIRRWETGRSIPSHFDLQRFAEVCHLTAIETAFVLTAFSAMEIERPPESQAFRDAATSILSVEFPAYLMDSFFFLRASNSYMAAIDGPATMPGQEPHVLRGPLLAATRPNETEDQEHRLWRWLRDFWFSTAELCGSIPYRRVLRELCTITGFENNWRRLALERHPTLDAPLNVPYRYKNARVGTYCVFPSRVMLPPTYHLRVYVPIDDVAVERVEQQRRLGPPRVDLGAERHWSNRLVKAV
jgi:hypothetical protein